MKQNDKTTAIAATTKTAKTNEQTVAEMKTTEVAAEVKTRKPRTNKYCVSSVARQMVLDGKTNDEIWDELTKEFKLDDKKKGYPNWYRNEMVGKGFIKYEKDEKSGETKMVVLKKLPPIVK